MAVIVCWPDGQKEEFDVIKLSIGREFADKRMIILNDAEVFIGANSCTIRREKSTTLYPYAIVQEIALFFEGAPIKAAEPSTKLELET